MLDPESKKSFRHQIIGGCLSGDKPGAHECIHFRYSELRACQALEISRIIDCRNPSSGDRRSLV
jgi:hypothetical protein